MATVGALAGTSLAAVADPGASTVSVAISVPAVAVRVITALTRVPIPTTRAAVTGGHRGALIHAWYGQQIRCRC